MLLELIGSWDLGLLHTSHHDPSSGDLKLSTALYVQRLLNTYLQEKSPFWASDRPSDHLPAFCYERLCLTSILNILCPNTTLDPCGPKPSIGSCSSFSRLSKWPFPPGSGSCQKTGSQLWSPLCSRHLYLTSDQIL